MVDRFLSLFPAWCLGLIVLSGCAEDMTPGEVANLSPAVWLASAPPEGSTTEYRIHLFWGGSDPDGQIAYYEYIITNNESGIFNPADTVSTPGDYKWMRTDVTDDEFLFSADEIADSTSLDDDDAGPYEFTRSHTFLIRAVDDRGGRSEKPAYRSFTARTLSPVVVIEVPVPSGLNPARILPITTFKWTAVDYVGALDESQPPDEVRHILVNIDDHGDDYDEALRYIRENPSAPEWSDWIDYDAPGGEGQSWTTPPLDLARFIFAVQAKDEAGAVTPVFDLGTNVRRLIAASDGWPILTVFNKFIGTRRTTSLGNPPVIVDIPSGVEMVFEWSASAEHYGGIIAGYRYGWDILDLNDDDQWTDWTPFVGETAQSEPRTFFFGAHSFAVEIIDNNGFKARFESRVNIVPFTMENGLLLVDDWIEGPTCYSQNAGVTPCDAEHDQFWVDALASVADFNPAVDVFEITPGRKVPLTLLARYKSVIWTAQGDQADGTNDNHLDDVISFRDPDRFEPEFEPNTLAMYMAAGGHVLLCGDQIMTLVGNNTGLRYPLIFRYELGRPPFSYLPPDDIDVQGENSFAYRECCLNVLDQSHIQNANQVRAKSDRPGDPFRCDVSGIRDNDRSKEGMRVALPIDVSTGGGFPRLGLRPEVSAPGKFFESVGMVVDVYNPLYFAQLTDCGEIAGLHPPRSCFEPMYGNGCADSTSVIYDAPVATWTSQFADIVPAVPGGVAARSAIWGFHPVFFNPSQVKLALEIILHDEWRLPRKKETSIELTR